MSAAATLAWVELKLLMREPLTLVFVLVLPLAMLYVLNGVFGSSPADPSVWEGIGAIDFYTPSYVALVAATVGILSVPVHLAGYRENGVIRRFRASAISPGVLVVAHTVVATIIATLSSVVLAVASALGYEASLPTDWVSTLGAFAFVTIGFAVLGSAIGAIMPTARAAQGLGVLLFFVFMMLGGAGPPLEILPDTMADIAEFLPITHAARLLRGAWLGEGWESVPALVVGGMLVVGATVAMWRFAED
ncbi:MAG TPA: ABC transporter permease [Acidimicrobiia bacterium]|nr:ABC transporter permease [Acidimicrobiia bacterium]